MDGRGPQRIETARDDCGGEAYAASNHIDEDRVHRTQQHDEQSSKCPACGIAREGTDLGERAEQQ